MKILKFSILVCFVKARTCQEKNKEIRKHNDNLKGIANKALRECQQKIAGERWTQFASETQKNMFAYVDQQAKNAKADQKFCGEMKRVYGPLNFEKPAPLDCVYDTDLNRKNCGDANEYDSTCETGAEVKRLEPQDEVNGQRVPNIVILGTTGSGKSFFCNGLLGYGNPDMGVFGTGALGTSCTRKPAGMHAKFYNDVLVAHGVESMAINLFDTPGFADSDKCQIEANKQRIVEKFDKPIDVFGYLMHPDNPRIDYNQQVIFKNLNEWTLGNIWSNLVIIYGRIKFSSEERYQRYSEKRSYKRDLEEKIHSIREVLWKMAQEGEWKKTYLDSQTNEVTSRLLNKEDFNNIQYSALNVNQNRLCPFIMEGKGRNEDDRYCAKKAKFTSPPSFDYEDEVVKTQPSSNSSSNPFGKNGEINMNSGGNINEHEFVVEDDKWILIEEAKRFQDILKKNMKHPVSPAKEFWRKQYEKDLQEYYLRNEVSKESKNSLGKILDYEGVDYSNCTKTEAQYLKNLKQESDCPIWGPWKDGQCDAKCGLASKKVTRECFLGLIHKSRLIETNECKAEYWTDSNEFKYELCDLPECEMGQWENLGSCSKTCGGGQQVQRRNCNGNDCGSRESTVQLIECATEKCDVWSSWSAWSECSLFCGGGAQKRERLLTEGAGKGRRESESQDCNTHICGWSQWSECERTCDGTVKKQHRTKIEINQSISVEQRTCIHRDCLPSNHPDQKEITPTYYAAWGPWGSKRECPHHNDLATGFRFAWEPHLEGRDDTAGNGFWLFCNGVHDNPSSEHYSIGDTGSWPDKHHTAACHKGDYLSGIQIQSQSSQGYGVDDTALNNVRMWCRNPVSGYEYQLSQAPATNWGTWTRRLNCPKYHGIMGVQLQIEPALPGDRDDTSLGAISIYCGPIDAFTDAAIYPN